MWGDIYCGFHFCFPDDEWYWTPFHMSAGHFYVGEMSIQVLCPFFNWVGFLLLSCMNPFCILNINPLSDIWFAVTFSHPLRQYFSITFSYWEHLLCLSWSGSFCCGSFGEPFLCSKWDYWTIKRVGHYLLMGLKGINWLLPFTWILPPPWYQFLIST